MSSHIQQPAASCWTLEGMTARLACDDLSGAVAVDKPWRGLSDLSYRGTAAPGRLLAVCVASSGTERSMWAAPAEPWPPSDVYVRGRDLVASYGETETRPFSLQIYWRAYEPRGGAGAAIDAIVSVQTRAWEAFPEVWVCSALPTEAVEIVRDDDASVVGVVLRPEGATWSYAETSLAGDFEASTVEIVEGGMRQLGWHFRREFMERGVIRRLRLRGMFLPREGDLEAVRAMREALAAEAPPLTA